MINNKKKLRSLISYIFLLKNILRKSGTSPSSGSYYFNIYSSHKEKLIQAGFDFPGETIGEFGPGDTLGVGICALLDGFNKYIALDTIRHVNLNKNMQAYLEIVNFYNVNNDQIVSIENELKNLPDGSKKIKYYVPWNLDNIIVENSTDLIISNAVLEHVLDLDNIYKIMYKWLKPGGYISHVIDYGAHEYSDNWYEHLYVSDSYWRFLMHGRMYPINRVSHSYHLNKISEAGFTILISERNKDTKADALKINKSICKFFNEDDLCTKSGLIIAQKRLF